MARSFLNANEFFDCTMADSCTEVEEWSDWEKGKYFFMYCI